MNLEGCCPSVAGAEILVAACRRAADAWVDGNEDLARRWMILATRVLGDDTFVDVDDEKGHRSR